LKASFDSPAPRSPMPLETVYAEFKEKILPHSISNTTPRNWGWVHGSGDAAGAFGEMWSAVLNANCIQFDHAPAYVELQTLQWLKEGLDFPPSASGVLLSGGSLANLTGLYTALVARLGVQFKRDGFSICGPVAFYGSQETHSSVARSLSILGAGSAAF